MGYTKDFVNYLGKMLEIENLKLVTRALLNKKGRLISCTTKKDEPYPDGISKGYQNTRRIP